MNYLGSCKCKKWKISVSIAEPLGNLNPRVCDCDYCKLHPSAVISDPRMTIELLSDSGSLIVNKNGDALASFYHCKDCGDLLAVGCQIDGHCRGAVNALLLDQKNILGEPVSIQPRLLSSAEKLSRWVKIWGRLTVPGVSSDI